MGWTESIGQAIEYIESNITNELAIEDIARQVCISHFYFQKGFAMLCGMTVGEYIRCRRLALAGSELLSSQEKVIDIALKYGYDSPDSFTKSFTRFHGITPSAARKGGAIKTFAPLKITLTLEGGYSMDYKIVEKDAFTVVGVSRMYKYEDAAKAVPQLWSEFAGAAQSSGLCGVYGINIDKSMGGEEFEYIIADNYTPDTAVPEGCITRQIPKFTWAVFACRGAMPRAMQDVNKKIFTEWLPGCRDYEIAAGYCIEMYSDPAEYVNGTADESYSSEMWIPVKKK